MMELGSGIAIAGVSISAGAVLLKALGNKIKNNPVVDKTKIVFKDYCGAVHKRVDDKLQTMSEDLKEIQGDVKELLRKR